MDKKIEHLVRQSIKVPVDQNDMIYVVEHYILDKTGKTVKIAPPDPRTANNPIYMMRGIDFATMSGKLSYMYNYAQVYYLKQLENGK